MAENLKGERMAQYTTCPFCGAHLDPGERCDCAAAKARTSEGRDIPLSEIMTFQVPEEYALMSAEMQYICHEVGKYDAGDALFYAMVVAYRFGFMRGENCERDRQRRAGHED